ncbi:MAG: carbon storage regulator [Spirochaetaceae bacterium]|nr:MAG: carbon storage regulator [Spirochaetaceae bacterium]
MLILARKMNESIIIGGEIEVSIIDIRGDQVKLGINAPSHVKVYRREVYEAILEENRQAAAARAIPPELDALFGGSGSADSGRTAARDAGEEQNRQSDD